MLILGLCCHHHDSSACLVEDGQLLAFVEEERLDRKKYSNAFPRRAIEACLRIAGVTMADVDRAAYFWVPWKGIGSRLKHLHLWLPRSLEVPGRYGRFRRMLTVPLTLRREFGFRGRFHFVDHYLAHAAASYFLSPFDAAAVLILDGNGEAHTAWAGSGLGTRLVESHREWFPNSLGRVYGRTTEHLGFSKDREEGKVMALGAFGDSQRFDARFRRVLQTRPRGRFLVDQAYFDHHIDEQRLTTPLFEAEFGPRRERDEPLRQRHFDLAATLQQVTEETVIHVLRHLAESTGLRDLCLGGGVALNCSMNGRIAQEGLFRRVFVPPPAGDAGAAIGAAMYIHHQRPGRRRGSPLVHPYWGPSYTTQECQDAARHADVPSRRVEDPAAEAAKLVADGKVVGWFQGAMEMGPRALGARSIVADPRTPLSCDRVNDKVKSRESFRPFAPSVLEERCSELFQSTQPSPFMLMAFPAQADARDRIPAVTHVDGTGRVQTVGEDANPRWRRLIEEFDRISGVPAVLNTSFNRGGEPIVCSPTDAIRCFSGSRMDALMLDDVLLQREDGPE
jgi:carbamoyltransferase